jgi:hypothetical protein
VPSLFSCTSRAEPRHRNIASDRLGRGPRSRAGPPRRERSHSGVGWHGWIGPARGHLPGRQSAVRQRVGSGDRVRTLEARRARQIRAREVLARAGGGL